MFKPYEGRETVAKILRTVFGVFEDFRYTDELEGDDIHGLLFEARVGDRSLQGIDLLRPDADGQIAEFTVMVSAITTPWLPVGGHVMRRRAGCSALSGKDLEQLLRFIVAEEGLDLVGRNEHHVSPLVAFVACRPTVSGTSDSGC